MAFSPCFSVRLFCSTSDDLQAWKTTSHWLLGPGPQKRCFFRSVLGSGHRRWWGKKCAGHCWSVVYMKYTTVWYEYSVFVHIMYVIFPWNSCFRCNVMRCNLMWCRPYNVYTELLHKDMIRSFNVGTSPSRKWEATK